MSRLAVIGCLVILAGLLQTYEACWGGGGGSSGGGSSGGSSGGSTGGSSSSKRAAIARTADKYVGDTLWSKASSHRTGRNTNKCNIFVAEVIEEAGASVPHRHWYSWSPIGAGEWGNPRSSYLTSSDSCWTRTTSPQNGDVAGDGVHVAIVTGYRTTTSAAQYRVVKNDWGFDPPNRDADVFWRYTCK